MLQPFNHQHHVIFYNTSISLWEQCLFLLKKSQPQSWLYITDEHSIEEITDFFITENIKNGIVHSSEAYNFRQPVIRVVPIIQSLQKQIKKIQKGETGTFLLFIEMTWAVRTPSGAIYLREYEAAIHQLAASLNISICCLYNQSILLDDQLMTALQTHPFIVAESAIKENPYFVPPIIFARRNQHQQFNFWLQKVVPQSIVDNIENTSKQAIVQEIENQDKIYHIDAPSTLIATNSEEGRWKIRCLGELKIYREDGKKIDWKTSGGSTRKLKTLFAYLLYKGERGATVEELTDLLWDDTTDLKQSSNRLYHAVRYLRKILSPDLKKNKPSPFILNKNGRYYLAVPLDTWIDLPMFQELCFRGNRHLQDKKLQNALICYQSAERLYKGELLEDIPNKYIEKIEQDWCWSRRFWYKEMHHKLMYQMANIYRQMNKISEALNYADKALQIEPTSEMGHQEKMYVLHAANRRDALQRQYRLYCKALKQFNMGEPATSVRQLYLMLFKEMKK